MERIYLWALVVVVIIVVAWFWWRRSHHEKAYFDPNMRPSFAALLQRVRASDAKWKPPPMPNSGLPFTGFAPPGAPAPVPVDADASENFNLFGPTEPGARPNPFQFNGE